MVSIEYHIKDKDLRDFILLNLKPRPFYAVAGSIIYLTAAIVLLNQLISSGFKEVEEPVLLFFIIALPAYLLIIAPYLAIRNYRKSIFSHSKSTVTFDENGFHETSDLSDTKLPWETFDYYKTNGKTMILHMRGSTSIFFPKHLFTEEQWQTFNTLCKDKIKKKA
ncbi:MAG: YcxB family protein [Sedimentisphaeraceae bacterium JB056]